MQDTGNQTKQTTDGHPAGFWHHTWHHIVDKWPETVLVAAVVTIILKKAVELSDWGKLSG